MLCILNDHDKCPLCRRSIISGPISPNLRAIFDFLVDSNALTLSIACIFLFIIEIMWYEEKKPILLIANTGLQDLRILEIVQFVLIFLIISLSVLIIISKLRFIKRLYRANLSDR